MREKILWLIYRMRGLLIAPMVIFMALCTWKEVENDVLVFSVGGIVFCVGLCFRVWSQMHLHHRLEVPKILTTTGPFAYIRNPCYVANILLLTGAAFLSELFWFAPLMLVYCAIVYSFVVRYEEIKLTRQYGTLYSDYLAEVPRWFPGLKGFPNKPFAKTHEFLYPSVIAETHNLLLLVPFLIKEVFC